MLYKCRTGNREKGDNLLELIIILEWKRDIYKHMWLYNRLVGSQFLHVVFERPG